MDNQNKPEVTRESGWEREVIEKLALAAITEQTRARRWGVFFKSFDVCVFDRRVRRGYVSKA